jgi:hypothetical protein
MLKRQFFNLSILLLICMGIASCGPEPKYVYKTYYQSGNGMLADVVCCYGPGTTCSQVGWEYIWGPSVQFKSYFDNDNIAGFFKNENWQQLFPDLVNHQDLINTIIATNPKGVLQANNIFYLIKNRNLPVSESNILYTFAKQAGPCDRLPPL